MTVVPTFAPNTMPSACANSSSPALAKPIAVTIVALDDCTRAVAAAPASAPRSGLRVTRVSQRRSRAPASSRNPSRSSHIPNSSSARPSASADAD